ncbi:toll/interleukin-1 receptor domain-containing protein [Sulfurimonas sp.]|uniref:toll/interleukin-1 receptor domain-containing protein n=1 Tax=Sulfurimonas sp. TaxID=2022749 RepID=UPI003D124CDE
MALFSYEELRQKTNYLASFESYDSSIRKGLLTESSSININSISRDSFDIFLSHSYADREIIPALKNELESYGFSVYVDWITDKLLSRDEINKKTAEVLQTRMKQSKCLIYATSDNSQKSRWMPWELGYFDGIKDKMVGILPLKKYGNTFKDDFKGEEYLGLYYYIDKATISGTNKMSLWVRENLSNYIIFESWIKGEKPYAR